MSKIKIIILLLCVFSGVKAQVSVKQEIDSMQMFIGEQVHLTLSVTMKQGQTAVFPKVKPGHYLTPGVEVLDMADGDTVKQDNDMVTLSRRYTLTSFDDTLYYLPPLTIEVDGKPYKSKNLALKVMTVDVDTLHKDQFFPPKDVQDNPFQWSDWSPVFWLSVLMLVLCLLGVYLYMRLRDNKPIIAQIRIIKKMLPHQKAMKEIERIKADRMTTSENPKEYYTQLTDTLRTYLKERFGFNAMEMTSSEIITRLRQEDDKEKLSELDELFETADLVKFAKYSTQINENDRNLTSAIEFINSTKKEDMPTEEKIEPQLTDTEKRTKRSRIVLKSLIGLVATVVVALLAYVIWQLILLIG